MQTLSQFPASMEAETIPVLQKTMWPILIARCDLEAEDKLVFSVRDSGEVPWKVGDPWKVVVTQQGVYIYTKHFHDHWFRKSAVAAGDDAVEIKRFGHGEEIRIGIIEEFTGVWTPPDIPYVEGSEGNTVLVEIRPRKYLQIESAIRQFTTEKPLRRYVSPIGDGNFSFPLAVSSDRISIKPDLKLRNVRLRLDLQIDNPRNLGHHVPDAPSQGP